MKKSFCVLFCIIMLISTLSACGGTDDRTPLFTVADKSSRKEVTAIFKNTDSGDTLEVKLQKKDGENDTALFTGHADAAKYDRVIIDSDGTKSEELAYNDFCRSWDLTTGRCYPGTEETIPKYERHTFDYEKRTKDILIWTPEDYDKSSSDKYSVIYMTDGQNLFDRSATSTGSWAVAESALAMAQNGGEKCIIVGIENADGWRDNELTPDIGEVTQDSYKDGHGKYFSDFVVDTVMPYINENYNVYTDFEHTHICGSSSGGIESFYIAMEHPDKFASVGALSPAFPLYSDETWVKYLSEKDFSVNTPMIYLYCGNGNDQLEQALCTGTKTMPDNLKKIGYPADRIVTKIYDDGIHNEMYWRAVFPDYLKYAFPKVISSTEATEK